MANRLFDEIAITTRMNNPQYNKTDVDRLMLERSFNYDDDNTNNTNNTNNAYNISNNIGKNIRVKKKSNSKKIMFGEITGEREVINGYDNGMPMRSSFTNKRDIRNNRNNMNKNNTNGEIDQNSHFDFNLYDESQSNDFDKKKLYYSEPSDGMYSNIEESMTQITDNTNPYETCIIGINTTNCWLNDNMASVVNKNYGISGYALYGMMGSLYLLSENDLIQTEYVSYFDFQDKKKLNAGLLTLRSKMNDYRDQFTIDNYVLSNYKHKIDTKVAKGFSKLTMAIVVNPNESTKESDRVNSIISNVSQIKNLISSSTISSVESLSLVSVIKIKPVFAYGINKIIKGSFNQNSMRDYLVFIGISCGYYEDKEIRLIELPLKDNDNINNYVFGIITRKDDNYNKSNNSNNSNNSIADIKTFSTAIHYIKLTVFDEVRIPIVKERYKYRLNKILQTTGLKNIYDTESSDYYKLYNSANGINGAYITDCVQYMDLIIDKNTQNKKSQNKSYNTAGKYYANKEFDYYVRDVITNAIIVMGKIVD